MNMKKWPLAIKIVLSIISLIGITLLYKLNFVFESDTFNTLLSLGRSILVMFCLMLLLNGFFSFQLYTKILMGLVLGVVAGIVFKDGIGEMKPLGEAFIRLISLIVVPLVFASLLVGTAGLNDIRKLGRIGGKTVVYYLLTTSIAIIIGLVFANVFKPGEGIDDKTRIELLAKYQSQANKSITKAKEKPGVTDTLLNIIPKNPIKSMADGKMLQIIFFALTFGIALTLIPQNKSSTVIAFFDGVNEAMIQIVNIVMLIAPYGVFVLIAHIIGKHGTGILLILAKYAIVVVLALLVHALVILPTAVRFISKLKIAKFFSGIKQALLIAFSSSSSSATLPVTLKCVEENLKVSPKVAGFVLPLGATINMDGTALYQAVAAVFIAQVYGLELTVADQLTIVLSATLASIGTAGVPGVGMITLAMVLESLHIPLEGIALILGVDRILDMCRTAVNVTGDASAAVVIASSENELDKT